MMGRLIWTHTFVDSKDDHLFGNLFVLLVGPAGSGKTKAVVEARNVVRYLGCNVGPDDCSGEKLFDLLKENKDNPNEAPGTMSLFLDEWDSLIHSGMSATAKRLLCHLYDCRTDPFERQTYNHGNQRLRDLCLTLNAGCTPAHLYSSFAPLEWQEGLPSRLMLIYGEKPAFAGQYRRGSMEALLREAEETLAFIGSSAKIGWSSEAMEAYVEWCTKNWSAETPHPLLGGYIARRPLHLAKLSFVLAVARQSSKIELRDWKLALSAVKAMEADLDKCLALSGGNETKDIEGFIEQWMRSRAIVNEWEVRRMIGMRVSHHMIDSVINELVAQRVLVQEGTARMAPNRVFRGGRE